MGDSVMVATPRLVYVVVIDRSEFDRIASIETVHAPKEDNGSYCISKRVHDGEVGVIFQHWVTP